MFDILDLYLLRRGVPADDRTTSFRRFLGNPASRVIFFLPWHTPFSIARQIGCVAVDYLACYEMPPAIVSSEPELSVRSMLGLIADAEQLLASCNATPEETTIVGLSVGNYPAIYLANRIGARVCAVAPADRADLMLWQSPAARLVKRRAIQRGVRLSHYSRAMLGCHPVGNLAGIGRNSMFVMGDRDPFIPTRRSEALLQAVASQAPTAQVVRLDAGHVKTLIASGQFQRSMLHVEPARRTWQMRLPLPLPFARLPNASG